MNAREKNAKKVSLILQYYGVFSNCFGAGGQVLKKYMDRLLYINR